MNRADQIIRSVEMAAIKHQEAVGCAPVMRRAFQVGQLERELRKAYDLLLQASHPEGCTEVNACGITAGALPIVNDDNELDGWALYIGGQCVDDVLDRKVRDKLCDEAERIALDGEAA